MQIKVLAGRALGLSLGETLLTRDEQKNVTKTKALQSKLGVEEQKKSRSLAM